MPKLVIHGGHESPKTVSLQSGTYRVGRSDDNEITIPSESVSSRHCEISVKDGQLWLVDRGSTNGTFVNGNQIHDGLLIPGQSLQIGDIRVEIVADEPPAATPETSRPRLSVGPHAPVATASAMPLDRVAVKHLEPAPVAPSAPAIVIPGKCSTHTEVVSLWVCQSCAAEHCNRCVKAPRVQGMSTRICPFCQGDCLAAHEHRKSVEREHLSNTGYAKLVPGAFSYPLKDMGGVMIFGAAILLSFLDFVLFARAMGIRSFFALVIAVVFVVGYCASYLQRVIQDSMQGESQVPGWPDFSNWYSDIIDPFFKFVATIVACFGPAIVLLTMDMAAIAIPVGLLGMVCLPMALLTVAAANSYGGLNPLLIFSSISKIPGTYLTTFSMFMVIVVVRGLVAAFLGNPKTGFLVKAILAGMFNLVFFYSLMVQMRLLGLMYYTNRKILQWF